MLILHDAGLSSAVAMAMATKISTAEQINVVHGVQDNYLGHLKREAAQDLCDAYGLPLIQLPTASLTLPRLMKLVKQTTDIAVEKNIQEIIVGIYNKGNIEVTMELINAMNNLVNSTSSNTVRLRTPLSLLTYGDIVNKAIDFELPLEYVRDCINTTPKFCGICLPCRHRIAQFQLKGFMDYDYHIDINWGLTPAEQEEFERMRNDEG